MQNRVVTNLETNADGHAEVTYSDGHQATISVQPLIPGDTLAPNKTALIKIRPRN